MDDFDKYIEERKKKDPEFAKEVEAGYEHFKLGVMLRVLREQAGLSQEELASRINTGKSVISRIENHAEQVCLSTLEKYAGALGKNISVQILP